MVRPMHATDLKSTIAIGSKQQIAAPVLGLVMLAMTCGSKAESLTILMPDGSPATKARVEFHRLESTRNEEPEKLAVQTLEVNSKGVVELKDLPSKHSNFDQLLVIDAPGAALALHNFFKDSETIRLVPAFEVNGRMVTVVGEGVADANVRLVDFGTHTYAGVHSTTVLNEIPGFQTKTDENGLFKLRGATLNGYDFPVGAYLLGEAKIAQKRFVGCARTPYGGDSKAFKKSDGIQAPTPEPPINLVVYPSGRVSGTVLDGHTNKPREGARVRIIRPHLGYHGNPTVTVDKDGSFSFEDVPSYGQRSFEVLWEEAPQAHPLVLSSPKDDHQPADVTGLRIPTYDGMLCKGSVVDAVSGKPPIIPLDLGYEQKSDPGQGWTVRTSGEWGNIGMDARTGNDGSFSMWLPTGPFSFTARAGDRFDHQPYDHKQEMNLKPGDNTPLLIKVPRERGILIVNHSANHDHDGDEFWKELIISVGPLDKNWFGYAPDEKMWFFPVDHWGDKIAVSVDHRASGDKMRMNLLPKTTIMVKEGMWPYVLEIPKE